MANKYSAFPLKLGTKEQPTKYAATIGLNQDLALDLENIEAGVLGPYAIAWPEPLLYRNTAYQGSTTGGKVYIFRSNIQGGSGLIVLEGEKSLGNQLLFRRMEITITVDPKAKVQQMIDLATGKSIAPVVVTIDDD